MRSEEHEKRSKPYFMILMESKFPLQKIVKSSTKAKCVRCKRLHRGWNLKPSALLAFIRILDRYSISKTKSRGNIGSPCLNPLLALKTSKGLPLMVKGLPSALFLTFYF